MQEIEAREAAGDSHKKNGKKKKTYFNVSHQQSNLFTKPQLFYFLSLKE